MNLHSTMFLLIPMKNIQIPIELFYLHSTMFLLIQPITDNAPELSLYLHSTMFLLILKSSCLV